MRALVISVLTWTLYFGLLPSQANSEDVPNATTDGDPRCQALQSAALANDLPLEFFTRLIWQESRFNDFAISRAGAQGIAQFMPATATGLKLANPFDAIAAIDKSAQLLRGLRVQFGNLGLAGRPTMLGQSACPIGSLAAVRCRTKQYITSASLRVIRRTNGARPDRAEQV